MQERKGQKVIVCLHGIDRKGNEARGGGSSAAVGLESNSVFIHCWINASSSLLSIYPYSLQSHGSGLNLHK